jgi:uncharacterized protein (DUF4415 family)
MASRKRSRDEEINLGEMFDVLEEQQAALDQRVRSFELIPPGWHSLERVAPVTQPKTKLTLSLDTDMVNRFRALGRGYQPRMNAVLRAYMHAMVSKEIVRRVERDWKGEAV